MDNYKSKLASYFKNPEVVKGLMTEKMTNGVEVHKRSEAGLAYTFARIGTAITNLAMSGRFVSAHEAFSTIKKKTIEALRFSARDGVNYRGATTSMMQNVMNTDVVDISMSSTIEALWSWFAVERPMDQKSTNFTYSRLMATNSTANFPAGSIVISPITAPPTELMSGNSENMTGDITLQGQDDKIEFGGPIRPGSILGYIDGAVTPGKEEIIDMGNGRLFGKGYVASVDYRTGVVTFENNMNVTYAQKLVFNAIADRVHDKTGDHVVKMTTEWVSKFVAAQDTQLIIQGNIYDNITYNKMIDNISQWTGGPVSTLTNPYENTINQLIQADMAAKNNMAIDKLIEASNYAPQLVLDWSNMTITNYAPTYQLFVKMNLAMVAGDMASRTDRGVTCWVVDMKFSMMLKGMEGFVANGVHYENARDGLIGTLDGVPVVRAAKLNGKSRVKDAVAVNNSGYQPAQQNPDDYGLAIGVYKDLDGLIAPCAFGEYLPPYTTVHSGNWDQPIMQASTLFSCVAVDILAPELCCSVAVKPFPVSTQHVATADPK